MFIFQVHSKPEWLFIPGSCYVFDYCYSTTYFSARLDLKTCGDTHTFSYLNLTWKNFILLFFTL